MGSINLVEVDADNLEHYWLLSRELIDEAVKFSDGKYETIDVLRALIGGRMKMFVAEGKKVEALAITQVVDYPRLRVCKILCCTGNGMKNWTNLLAGIENWAKIKGCKLMEPECRLGWAKVLAPLGYERGHILLKKVI